MNEGANLFAVLFFSLAAAVRACWNEGRVRGSWGPISRSLRRGGKQGSPQKEIRAKDVTCCCE